MNSARLRFSAEPSQYCARYLLKIQEKLFNPSHGTSDNIPLSVLPIRSPLSWTPHPQHGKHQQRHAWLDEGSVHTSARQLSTKYEVYSTFIQGFSKWGWSFWEGHHLMTYMVLALLTARMMCMDCNYHIQLGAIFPTVRTVHPRILDFGSR